MATQQSAGKATRRLLRLERRLLALELGGRGVSHPVQNGAMLEIAEPNNGTTTIIARKNGRRRRRNRRKPRNPRITGQTSDGVITIRRKELLGVVSAVSTGAAKGTCSICPHPDNKAMPFLTSLAKCFDRWKITRATVSWTSAQGTTKAGTIALGMDWDFGSGTDFDAVTACSPYLSTSIWDVTKVITLPANRLQSRAWYVVPRASGSNYVDYGPGRIVYNAVSEVTSGTLGQIWIDYTVTLMGPTKS